MSPSMDGERCVKQSEFLHPSPTDSSPRTSTPHIWIKAMTVQDRQQEDRTHAGSVGGGTGFV